MQQIQTRALVGIVVLAPLVAAAGYGTSGASAGTTPSA